MQCQSLYLLYLYIVTFVCTFTVQCTCVQAYSHPSTQVSCISIIKAQRAHNNYKNIILKEPNEKPQRAHLGARAPLWTTLWYKSVEIINSTKFARNHLAFRKKNFWSAILFVLSVEGYSTLVQYQSGTRVKIRALHYKHGVPYQ